MPKSTYLANAIVAHALGKASFTMPAAVYLALCTGTPSQASTGATLAEATYTGYARVQVLAASLAAAVSGIITNSADIAFGACTGGSSTIVGWAVCDAAGTGAGNVLYYGTLPSFSVVNTVTPKVYAGTLSVAET